MSWWRDLCRIGGKRGHRAIGGSDVRFGVSFGAAAGGSEQEREQQTMAHAMPRERVTSKHNTFRTVQRRPGDSGAMLWGSRSPEASMRHATRRVAVLLPVALFLAGSLSAQTTPTERAAAGAVLATIDSLQTARRPAALAERLATPRLPSATAARPRCGTLGCRHAGPQRLDRPAPRGRAGRSPRPPTPSSRLLGSHGFTVDSGVAGLATAFVATWDSPAGAAGPMLGLIAEYDALRGTQGAFHGDQHNAQSPVAFAAALALKEYSSAKRLPGGIRIYGTPAEEVGPPAKSIMRDAGVFKGASILVRSHPPRDRALPRRVRDLLPQHQRGEVHLHRPPSHQLSSWNGRNALEAAVALLHARWTGCAPRSGPRPRSRA